MFTDEEMEAFYKGKDDGYSSSTEDEDEYKNPHIQFIDQLTKSGIAYHVDNPLYKYYQRGYEWGKAQKDEENL